MPYNVRATIGKKKGKFTKKKVEQKILKIVQVTSGKQGRRITERESKESEVRKVDSNQVPYANFEGRRIVEMDKLAEDLWCTFCDLPLSLRFAVNEKQQGIVSKISVKCQACKNIVVAETSSRRTKYYYDSNLKLAVGMMDAGMGETSTNTFISALNIPTVSATSLKRYERHVGSAVEKLAQKSCIEAIKKEKLLTLQNKGINVEEEDIADNNNNVVDLIASFDAAWAKRGRQFNSLSGHSSLDGHFSKKVIAYACRNIICRKCKAKDRDHQCRQNHNGSSKSMEADMAVEVILKNVNFINLNCRIGTFIGDDDSSAIAALRRFSPYVIIKWSDFNHTKKTFNTKLYDIKLSATLREYFSKVFSLAIKQNKGNEVEVKMALENIVPHTFGNHERCGSFCKTSKNSSHIYKYFKDGQCLSDSNLKHQMEKILLPFINSSTQIAPCGSSQSNESFNRIVCSKHPKSSFYGGSESHCYRVAMAVCQKNIGYEFVLQLHTILNLSPGKRTQIYRKRKQDKFVREAGKRKKIPAKKRRLELKKERSCKNTSIAHREGIAYQSGCGYLNTSDLIDEVIIAEHTDFKSCSVVVFDLETTGLSKSDEIVQIATVCENNAFDVYIIMPKRNMNHQASDVTGIKIINKEMYVNDKQVMTSSPRDELLSFLYFLKVQKKPVILLAHNGERFDSPRIIQHATSVGLLKEFKTFVKGFCDTLDVFKSLLPERAIKKETFKLGALANDYLDQSDLKDAHNALNDVLMLEKLLQKLCKNNTCIYGHTKTFDFIMNSKNRKDKIKTYKQSLEDIPISKNMKHKIATAGIDKIILKKACETGGFESLSILFRENVQGKPHVTNTKSIIQKIFDHLSK